MQTGFLMLRSIPLQQGVRTPVHLLQDLPLQDTTWQEIYLRGFWHHRPSPHQWYCQVLQNIYTQTHNARVLQQQTQALYLTSVRLL